MIQYRERAGMGKKRVGPDRGPVTTTKVYADVLKRARGIANHKDITLFDLVDEILVSALEREHAKMMKELTRDEPEGRAKS